MRIRDYQCIVGEEEINELRRLSERLKDKRIVMINSTNKGGGVAEILLSLVPLFNRLGIKTEWLVLNGAKEFFDATKCFHNALQGEPNKNIKDSIVCYQNFYDTELKKLNQHIIDCLENASEDDIFVIHDPQPLGLIKYKKNNGLKLIWRKHIDTSNPHEELWKYIYSMASCYDKIIVSKSDYIRGDSSKYVIIPPSIDPFTDKNKELSEEEIKQILEKYNVPIDKPIITQVSRLDKWKDPVGVMNVFREVKKKVDCRLVLIYSEAKDDPEGEMMYKIVKSEYEKNEEDIILLGKNDPLLVNAMQRVSDVVLQKSLKEGFALTVSEALWKGTPVVASRVGGIPLQIHHGKNGYLINGYGIDSGGTPINPEERKLHIKKTAECVVDLLSDPVKRKRMGKHGKEHIRKNFLITRHAKDYLNLFNSLCDEKIIKPVLENKSKN